MRWILLLLFLVALSYAQFDSVYTMASSWSMWSAWSTCAPEGVMIRVRACSTVRGFKCVGRNKEFKSCVLQQNKGDEDFDQVDEDRQMAMKQLYQDYDLHGDAAAMPKPPQVLPPQIKSKPYMPPKNDVLVVAPPGSRNSVVSDKETTFKGSFKSLEEEEPIPVPTRAPLMVTEQVGYRPSPALETSEELMEDETEGWATPSTGTTTSPPTLPTIPSKSRYNAKYVTQGPSTTETTTTEAPTTTEEIEEEVDVTDEEDPTTENVEILEFTTSTAQPEDDEDGELPETVYPVARVRTTETTTTLTTEEPTTTPRSFVIPRDEQEEIPESVQPIFMGANRVKIHGRTKLQQLHTIVGEQQKMRPLGMLSPVAPPRLKPRVHHSGEIDTEEEKPVQKPKERRMKKLKHKKRTGAVAPLEEFVTGDTARALNWLIANMTNSVGDEGPSLTDKVVLERYALKETKTGLKWSQWSLWSECRCGMQRRKRICLPTSSELIQENSKCPLPEFEERICNSNQC